VALLIYFAALHHRNGEQLKHYELRSDLCAAEQEASQGNYSGFDMGEDFNHSKHAYAHDLDLFGAGSLFQMISRAVSSAGREMLAMLLKSPYHSKDKILAVQKAISELSRNPTFLLDYLTAAKKAFPGKQSEQNLKSWAQQSDPAFLSPGKKILLIAVPVVTAFITVLMALGEITFLMFLLYLFLVPIGISGYYYKRINTLHSQLGRQSARLKGLTVMLRMTEEKEWHSEELHQLVVRPEGDHPSAWQQINMLNAIMERFDYRLNFIAGFLLNAFLLWDLRLVHHLELWKQKSGGYVEQWLQRLHRMEVLISQALFSYHHHDFIFPEVTGEVLIDGDQVAHPFISSKSRVGNKVAFSSWKTFKIITGGNMAGKSTYLRTVGINLVLAMSGNVVCAQKFRFSPVTLITSIRTDDSLQENESFFYAELKKLQDIILRLERGEKLFLLLDEILKGTNSRDKLHGSRALLQQLLTYYASGAVATHDIALGDLEKDFPENITNHCFEIAIRDNALQFDYKLRRGKAENMNAVFLMKQMGITV
jgi:hypothetical protein